jgi:hypothetical protein
VLEEGGLVSVSHVSASRAAEDESQASNPAGNGRERDRGRYFKSTDDENGRERNWKDRRQSNGLRAEG